MVVHGVPVNITNIAVTEKNTANNGMSEIVAMTVMKIVADAVGKNTPIKPAEKDRKLTRCGPFFIFQANNIGLIFEQVCWKQTQWRFLVETLSIKAYYFNLNTSCAMRV
jgi:hypothetical protein